MEDRSEGNEGPRETITLILNEKRFQVDKEKLIRKSQYFAVLLSSNYRDHCQKEHVINYDIPLILFQNFINWIHVNEILQVNDFSEAKFDNEECDHNDFSKEKFNSEECDDLLSLLELSVLFAVDNLIEYIVSKLEIFYMFPKYVIHIWLQAQEFNTVLGDVALAVCLDRFNELPRNSIWELSRKNFLKLIGNVNIRTTEQYLLRVAEKWMKHNNDFTIPLNILREQRKKPKILHSIVSCESDDINSEQFIYCWDGNDFFELTSFKYPEDIINNSAGKMLRGMQIVARGCYLYLCGGEFGIDTDDFNMEVWRYSLISKNWHLETLLVRGRKHMIAAFLENKLVLVGGVGQFQRYLQSVDIYDIHAGYWTPSNTTTSLELTNVCEHFVFNDFLYVCEDKCVLPTTIHTPYCGLRTYTNEKYGKHIVKYNLNSPFNIFIYCVENNAWTLVDVKVYCPSPYIGQLFNWKSQVVSVLSLKTRPCYIDINNPNKMVLRAVEDTCKIFDCKHVMKIVSRSIVSGISRFSDKRYAFDDYSHNFVLYYCMLRPDNRPLFALVCADQVNDTFIPLHLHSIPIRNPNKFRSLLNCSSFNGFFNLTHPAHLHTCQFEP